MNSSHQIATSTLSHHRVLAFIGQHIGEDVLWKKSADDYSSHYPDDDILFYPMIAPGMSGLAINLRLESATFCTNSIAEIEQVVAAVEPTLVLDLHTHSFRRCDGPSDIYALPSWIDPEDDQLGEFPFYKRINGDPMPLEADKSVVRAGMKVFPDIKSYVVEFDYGSLKPSEWNRKLLDKIQRHWSECTPLDRWLFKRQIFNRKLMKQDARIAREFIHFLYELNIV
ncbi:MAG: hypothetical protein ABIH34_02090 [Nanoarchaeota archaeon]